MYVAASASAATVTRYQALLRSPHNALHSPSYYILLSYVRRGLCDPPFFFLRRALCTVQSSCTVLFRCARPTHALHASSYVSKWLRNQSTYHTAQRTCTSMHNNKRPTTKTLCLETLKSLMAQQFIPPECRAA